MKRIVLFAQKGGAGKTTIAIHLAVAAMNAGKSVILVDTDPQGSATGWARLRGDREPQTFRVEPQELGSLMEAATADGVDVAVIDTAPHASLSAAAVLSHASTIVIPTRPTVLDLMALEQTLSLVRASGNHACAVLSAVPTRSAEADEAAALLHDSGLPVAPVRIRERRAYARALASGAAVTEFGRSREAAEEIRGLWGWLDSMVA